MLIAKIYINEREIDNIYIHNTGLVKDGEHIYRIMNPETGEVLTKITVSHKRTDGYRKLLIKVLEVLENENIPTSN